MQTVPRAQKDAFAAMPCASIRDVHNAQIENWATVLRKTGWDRPGNHWWVSNSMADPVISTTAQASGQQTHQRICRRACIPATQSPKENSDKKNKDQTRHPPALTCKPALCLLTQAQPCWGDAVFVKYSSCAFCALLRTYICAPCSRSLSPLVSPNCFLNWLQSWTALAE